MFIGSVLPMTMLEIPTRKEEMTTLMCPDNSNIKNKVRDRPSKLPRRDKILRPCKCVRHELRQGESGISEQGGGISKRSQSSSSTRFTLASRPADHMQKRCTHETQSRPPPGAWM
jgi:hypothetical protein